MYLRLSIFSFVTIILFFSIEAAAQFHSVQEPVKVTFYYNAVWELTTAENSMYRREAYFDLTDLVFDGVFSDYNKKGELIADGIYNHGIKSGIHTEYANHSVKTKVEYSDDDFTLWEWNSENKNGVKNGNGKFSMPYFYFISIDGQITPRQGVVDGEFQQGRRVGRWVYHDLNKFKTDQETYSNGKLLRRVRYTKNDSSLVRGKKSIYLSLNSLNTESLMFDKGSFSYLNQYFEKYITYPSSFQRNATYPGGLKQLLKLLARAMMVPDRNLELVRLKIDEHGQLVKYSFVRSINEVYDNLTDQLLEVHQLRFLPFIRNGSPIAGAFTLPIASGEDWMRMLDEQPIDWFLNPDNFN